jgi:hypothetical protein
MLHHTVELCLVVLIFLDVAAVCCEIMLTSVCPKEQHSQAFCLDDALFHTYEKEYHNVEKWEAALGWISKCILLLFLLKELLLIFALCPRAYFSTPAHVLDFFITIVALALELGFSIINQASAAATLSNLVIVLLVWRVLRLLHGLLETSLAVRDDGMAQQLKDSRLSVDALNQLLHSLQQRVRQLELEAAAAAAPRVWQRGELLSIQIAFQQSGVMHDTRYSPLPPPPPSTVLIPYPPPSPAAPLPTLPPSAQIVFAPG